MRTRLVFAYVLMAFSSAPSPLSAAAQSSQLAADELVEINNIFREWERAWQAHDMSAWAQLFHEDATYVTWFGDVLIGREVIEKAMVEAHATVFRNSVQLSRPEEIRLVGPGVVVARSFTTLTGDARDPQAIYGRKLVVLTQRNGRWKILYGQAVRLSGRAADAVRQERR